MPLWDSFKQHLKDHAFAYIAGGLFPAIVAIWWLSWNWAKTEAESEVLDFLTDTLTIKEPNLNPDQSKRNADLARAISGFQQGVLGFVKDSLSEKDPNKLPDGKKRNADLAGAISDFQKSVVGLVSRQVRKINESFVGYVQAGTFVLLIHPH